MSIRGRVANNITELNSKLESSIEKKTPDVPSSTENPTKGLTPEFPSNLKSIDNSVVKEAQARSAAAFTSPIEDEVNLLKAQVAAQTVALNALLPAFNAIVGVIRKIPGAGNIPVPSLSGLPSITANIPLSSDISGLDDLPPLTPVVSTPTGIARNPDNSGVTVESPKGPLRDNEPYYRIVANAAAARIMEGQTQYIQRTDPTQILIEDVIRQVFSWLQEGKRSVPFSSNVIRLLNQRSRILVNSSDMTFKVLTERGYFN